MGVTGTLSIVVLYDYFVTSVPAGLPRMLTPDLVRYHEGVRLASAIQMIRDSPPSFLDCDMHVVN